MKLIRLFLVLNLSSHVVFASKQTVPKRTLNDVTYILPLPTQMDQSLLQTQSLGLGGELVPKNFITHLPNLTMLHTDEEIIRDTYLVALRFDPCFIKPTGCEKQIRMVWQPLELDENKKVTSVDAAFHSFYKLSDSEFDQLLKDINAWKLQFKIVMNELEPLDVHPAWKHEGATSPALKAFQQMILKYAGKKNLNQLTASVLRRQGDVWGFMGMEIDSQGSITNMNIARTDQQKSQLFINELDDSKKFVNAMINPIPQDSENNFSKFMKHSETFSESELLETLRSSFRIENPKNFHAGNMDCVSCHVSQSVREFAEVRLPQDKVQAEKLLLNYSSAFNLKNKTTEPYNTHHVRALGYFKDQLVVSQRVIHESAQVAKELDQQNPIF